ncbi:hypothetical protein V2J52_13595 [Georgenia sp. MJ173]|uniref:HD domain-containing protein n=1 Tax=Georgenia sunbinii TaxID=3117728 RepID=UPI002F25F6C8
MSVTDAPQWLLSAFVRSVAAVGATAPREEIQRVGRRLLERWQEPGRSFHNVRHLMDVLARVEELAEETHRPEAVRLAAWYHGAVFNASALVAYARRGGEDEAASAALARQELATLGVPTATTDRVHDLIVNLKRHDADEQDVDALALCDADLGTLAVEPQRYAGYRKAVRAEYAHIPERDYVESRIAIITKLLARRRLFVSPFSLAWEEPARENLTAELSHLRARLAALGAADRPDPAGEAAATPTAPAAGEPAPHPATAPAARPAEAAPSPAGAEPGPAADAAEDGAARPADQGVEAGSGTGEEDTADAATTDADIDIDIDIDTTEPADAPETPDVHERSRYGIEREPDLDPRRRGEHRSRRLGRRERPAPPPASGDDDSTGSLFRPPPNLPRT